MKTTSTSPRSRKAAPTQTALEAKAEKIKNAGAQAKVFAKENPTIVGVLIGAVLAALF
jgi:hypothetical protein